MALACTTPSSARTTRAGSGSRRRNRSRRSHAPTVALGRAQRRRGVRHSLPDGLRDGLRGVSDAETDDLRVRVLLQVFVTPARDLSHPHPSTPLCQHMVCHLSGAR